MLRTIAVARKGFFNEFFSFVREGVSHQLEKRIAKALDAPLRPPGALNEVGFLATCTRCNACADACPYQAIQRFPLEAGISANSPYIDAKIQSCQLCPDFPCIQVCEPKALLPLGEQGVAMGHAIVRSKSCQTWNDKVCTLCYDACPYPEQAITMDDDYHPRVFDACVGCGACQQRCPVYPPGVEVLSPLAYTTAQKDEDYFFGMLHKGDEEK